MKKYIFLLFIPLLSLNFVSCVDAQDEKKEEIRFALDARNYTKAIALGRELISENADDLESKELLASALLGQGALSGNPNCGDDSGILGLLACVVEAVEEEGATESTIETFARIAPNLEDIPELEEATDLLNELATEVTGESKIKEIALRAYVSKLFEIAGSTVVSGASSNNEDCNACSDGLGLVPCVANMKDQVGDDFDPNALEDQLDENGVSRAQRFVNNLQTIDEDGERAGLPSDFAVTQRFESILAEILSPENVATYFEIQFGAAKRACDQ